MKHKLLQTWARKSAKLLAAVALLATTAGVAMAETATFTVANLAPKTSYTKTTYKDAASGIELTAYVTKTTSPKDYLGLSKNAVNKNGNGGNWIAVSANDNEYNIVSVTLNNVYTTNNNGANLTVKVNSSAYTGLTDKIIKNPAGTEKYNEHLEKATAGADKNYSINDKAFIIYNNEGNGQVLLNGITITYEKTAVDLNKPAAPTFTPDGGEVDANTIVTIAGDDKTQSLKYWFGEDATAATTVTGATATVTITEACTLNAIAVGEGNVESGVKTASYTLTPAINTYKQITTELTSGKYVFMCGENFVDPKLVSNRCNFTTEFTKTDDQIVASEKYEFIITVEGTVATIQGENGKYLGIANENASAFTTADEALTDNFKWKYAVSSGVVTFTSAISDTNVLAQHMGNSSLYQNFAPGKVEGSVYPTLYKLYVAPVAPELPAPTAEDGVEVDVVDGGWGIRPEKYPVTLTFAVEDGVQIYAKKLTAAQAAAEDDNDGYTALPDNKLTLTKSGEEYSVYAMKDGVKSEAKTITANVPSGIAGIEAENGEAVYFNLQGVRVENPENGIFIRVQNGKAVKIMK